MDVDTWASLPPELLLEICSRLQAAAALSCTGVCKPWRRTIIGNAASCLRPRPDCFVPGLLLGFLHNHVCLQPTVTAAGGATPYDATDLAPYDEVLSSRDGLVLLCGKTARDLCLCNLMTGERKFLPAGEFKACTYVLLTGYDLTVSDGGGGGGGGDGDDHSETTLILAVKEKHIGGGMTYQILSTSDGAWGAVTRSPRFKKGHVTLTRIYPGSEVVCRGTVHWLAMGADVGVLKGAVGLDVRARRTWWTELPEGCGALDYYSNLSTRPARLATTAAGRLSLVRSFGDCLVEVWVLAGGDQQWALRRTIDVRSLLPCYCRDKAVWFSIFCPRSGFLLGHIDGKEKEVSEVLIDAERGSCCLIGTNHGERLHSYSYEMDWSTYLAKMKHL